MAHALTWGVFTACRDDPTIFSINLMNEPRCECHPPHIPLPANYTVLPSCQARAQGFALDTHGLLAPAQSAHSGLIQAYQVVV